MVQDFNEGVTFREWAELRVTWGSCHPETNSNGKLLSLLGPKEQREEIAFIPGVQRES